MANCVGVGHGGIQALLYGLATSRSMDSLDHSHVRGVNIALDPRVSKDCCAHLELRFATMKRSECSASRTVFPGRITVVSHH